MQWWKRNRDFLQDKVVPGIFYLGLTIELIIMLVEISSLAPLPEGQLFRVTFLLFAFKVAVTGRTRKEWLVLAITLVLAGAFYLYTGENILLRAVAFVAAMKGIKLVPALNYLFVVTLGGCIVMIGLSLLGVVGAVSLTQEFRQGMIETRYSLGLGHPNGLHCMFLMLLLLYMYIYRKRLSSVKFALIFIMNLGMFYLTDSKTAFAITTMAIVVTFIFYKSVKLQSANWIYIVGIIIFIGCIGLSIWAAEVSKDTVSNSILDMIDRFFSGRIRNLYWNTEAHAGALTSWKSFSIPGHFDYYFDMGWVRMFYWFGIIPGMVMTVMQVLLIAECRRHKDYMAMILIVMLAVYTIVEAHLVSVYLARAFPLFFYGAYGSAMLHVGSGETCYFWGIFKKGMRGAHPQEGE
jgi:hypothetical protein